MISKHIKTRKDGKSSASDALRYGEGLKVDRETGELLDKSHRTRIGNFGLVDDGIYTGRDIAEMSDLIDLAAIEMQANCDLNTRISADKKVPQQKVRHTGVALLGAQGHGVQVVQHGTVAVRLGKVAVVGLVRMDPP